MAHGITNAIYQSEFRNKERDARSFDEHLERIVKRAGSCQATLFDSQDAVELSPSRAESIHSQSAASVRVRY